MTTITLTAAQRESNWLELLSLIDVYMSPENAAKWKAMLLDLAGDGETETGEILLGFYRAPAASGNHHAYEGGLVAHLLEMWRVHFALRNSFPQLTECAPHVTDERVLTAILAHDLHKVYRTFILVSQPDEPWKVRYADEASDMLTTHDIKSLAILMRHGISMDDEQLNAFCLAEGGWSSIKPKWTTVLAKYCYLLDEMSGNVLARIAVGNLVSKNLSRATPQEVTNVALPTAPIGASISSSVGPVDAPPAPVEPVVESPGQCGVCGRPQFNSPGGLTCSNGHGGADTITTPMPVAVKMPDGVVVAQGHEGDDASLQNFINSGPNAG